jgi:hypothetical protein
MSPADYADTTRGELLLAAAEVLLAVRLGKAGTVELARKAERLARFFLLFDEWLTRGGDLPTEWKRS